MNSKLVGIVILVVAIGGTSVYFLMKDSPDQIDTMYLEQNEKIGLVINTINAPKNIEDLEKLQKVYEELILSYNNHFA